MASATITTIDSILKDTYHPDQLKALWYDRAPLLGMVKKKNNFVGDEKRTVLRYAAAAGGSATFARALANKTPNKYSRFALTRASDYMLGSITSEAIRAAKGKDGALADAVEAEMAGMTQNHKVSLAGALYRNGGGAIGQISSAGAAATTITLANPDDVVNFDVGMQLDGSAADGTSGAATTGGVASVISAINRDTGVLTSTGGANWSHATGIDSAAASWYLFRGGDFGAKIKGLGAWVPTSAPSATSFFGVDRSVDTTRLGGVRVTGEASIEESLLKGMTKVFREGGAVDSIFLNPEDFRLLVIALENKTTITRDKSRSSDAEVFYEGVRILGASGPATVYADPFCPKGYAYGLQMDTWCLHTLGEIGSVLDEDGSTMLREYNADAIEIRMVTFGQLGCEAPGYNFVATLPSSLQVT
jgi:hypothetical protein